VPPVRSHRPLSRSRRHVGRRGARRARYSPAVSLGDDGPFARVACPALWAVLSWLLPPPEARPSRGTGRRHFTLEIEEGHFGFSRNAEAIAAEAALDGIDVIRTSLGEEKMAAAEVETTYTSLANVERICVPHMKTVDVEIRPIRHRLADRVRTHAFICMLGAHLTWHLRRAWAPLTFSDEDPPERADSVDPAARSPAASSTAARRAQPDGTVLRPFQGLLDHLATLTRNTNKVAGSEVAFDQLTEPTPTQRRAFELLGTPIPLRIM